MHRKWIETKWVLGHLHCPLLTFYWNTIFSFSTLFLVRTPNNLWWQEITNPFSWHRIYSSLNFNSTKKSWQITHYLTTVWKSQCLCCLEDRANVLSPRRDNSRKTNRCFLGGRKIIRITCSGFYNSSYALFGSVICLLYSKSELSPLCICM